MSKRIEFQMMDLKRIRMKERAKQQLLLCKEVHEEQLAHNSKIENIATEMAAAMVRIMAAIGRMEERTRDARGFWARLFNR